MGAHEIQHEDVLIDVPTWTRLVTLVIVLMVFIGQERLSSFRGARHP